MSFQLKYIGILSEKDAKISDLEEQGREKDKEIVRLLKQVADLDKEVHKLDKEVHKLIAALPAAAPRTQEEAASPRNQESVLPVTVTAPIPPSNKRSRPD